MTISCTHCDSTAVTYYATLGGSQHSSSVPIGINTATGAPAVYSGPLCDAHAKAEGLSPTAFGRELEVSRG